VIPFYHGSGYGTRTGTAITYGSGSATLIKKTARHLGKVVAGVDHLRLEAEVGDEELEQLLGVARLLDLARHLGILENLQDRLRLRLQALEVLHHLQFNGQFLQGFFFVYVLYVQPVFRIHDILVSIRIRGSMPLLFSSLTFKTSTKNLLKKSFSAYLHHFLKIKSPKEVTKQ
jgi:hypothetical protein